MFFLGIHYLLVCYFRKIHFKNFIFYRTKSVLLILIRRIFGELEVSQQVVAFSQQEIISLCHRFCQTFKTNNIFISSDELLSIHELTVKPHMFMLLQMLDGLNFKEFVAFLSAFSSSKTLQKN
ncbi:hypothetical protein KSP40_PGU004685 [Platanthera guangdongensis]|uniref:Uncharacterized protein n=1 Tax=Platanthera guangdongensis TaxID=2320717 RepID=A0ABR2LZ20_9ASPA